MDMSSSSYWDSPRAGCAIVMAHPDDEVLWASSVLADAGKVILCFGDFPGKPLFSEGRRRAVAQLPFPGLEALQIKESAVAGTASWPRPEELPEGLAPRRLPFGLDAPLRRTYLANFALLCEALETQLAGIGEVVTHNPWGEYGHEDHVQVFRAVQAVQRKLGFRLWVTGYVGERAMGLMQRNLDLLGTPTRPLATNPELGDRLRRIYIENVCWSWPDDYIWPEVEWFYPVLSPVEQVAFLGERGGNPVRPVRINMIQTGWTPETGGRHLIRCVLRSLKMRAVRRIPVLGPKLERLSYRRSLRMTSRD